MAASLLVGFTACSDDPDTPDPTPETKFPTAEEGFASTLAQAPAIEMEEGDVHEFSFTPAYAWTLDVKDVAGPVAQALLASRADAGEPVFYLRNAAGTKSQHFEGEASTTPLTFALVVNYVPTGDPDAGVTGEVTLKIGTETQYCKAFVGNEEDAPGVDTYFFIYPGVPAAAGSDELFEMDEENNFIYADTPVTAVDMITDANGEKGYMSTFKVSSTKAFFANKPIWINMSERTKTAGSDGVVPAGTSTWTLTVNDTFFPIAETTESIVFIDAEDESENAATLGELAVSVPGCGDFVSVNTRMFPVDAIFSQDGRIYNENAGWMDYIRCAVTAAYGSQILFVSTDNWINFKEEIKFQDTDEDGNDLTKYGLQEVGGEVEVEINGENEYRKAYLIAVPANSATEELTPEKVFVDGKVVAEYEQYIVATATQLPYIPESEQLVTWAWGDDELGDFKRSDFAELTPIRPSADSEVFGTEFFVKDWALAPIAYHLHYYNLDGVTVAGLKLPENTATIEFYDEYGPFTEAGATKLEWLNFTFDAETGVLAITPAYDFDKDEWLVELPSDINWETWPAFFVVKDAEGNVITWIMFTLNPERYDGSMAPTNPIAGAKGLKGGDWLSLGLIPMDENFDAYDPDFSGPQFSLTLPEGVYTVAFDVCPSGSYKVYSPIDATEPTEELFVKQPGAGNVFTIGGEEESGEFWVYFNSCLLYVQYGGASEPTPQEPAILDARGYYADGSYKSLGVPPTPDYSAGYDPDFSGQQYMLTLTEKFEKLGFGKIPDGISYVCTVEDPGTGLSDVFVKSGDYYIFNAPATKGGVWVSFADAGCLLYIEYDYGTIDTPAEPMILDARGYRADGTSTSLGVPPTPDYSAGYDPYYSGPQYTLKLDEKFEKLSFGTIPSTIAWVCTLENPDENLSNVFVKSGDYYIFNAPATKGGVWVSFNEGCLLYIEYDFSAGDSGADSGAFAILNVSNGETTTPVTALTSSDPHYDFNVGNVMPQYYADMGDAVLVNMQANKAVSSIIATPVAVTCDGQDVLEKFTDEVGDMNSEMEFNWSSGSANGTLYFPYAAQSTHGVTTGHYVISIWLTSEDFRTRYAALTFEVDVIE